jgi:hypothetical protein
MGLLSTGAAQILLQDRMEEKEKESKGPDDGKVQFVSNHYRGEESMKLFLLFIVMDLLTLLAYPFVFVYGELRQFSRTKEMVTSMNQV